MKKISRSSKPFGVFTTIAFLMILFVFGSGFTPSKYKQRIHSSKCSHQKIEDNIDLVMAYFEAIDNRDADSIFYLFSEDAVQEFIGKDPIIGADAIAQQLGLAFSQLDSMETEVLNVIAQDDMVAIHVRHVATFAAGGVYKNRDGILPSLIVIKDPTQVTWQAMVTFLCKDGVITKEVIIRDDLSIMMQIGTVSMENF